MTHEERKALASRIKWDLIELLSETGSPVPTNVMLGLLDAISMHVQEMEGRLPEVEPRD